MPGYQSIPDHIIEAIPLPKFWSRVRMRANGCWEWQGSKDTHGYGQFWVKDRTWLVHRLAFTMTRGTIPPGLLVLHKCDHRACVNPTHLFLGTDMDNVQDMIRKGRANHPGGDRGGRPKFTWDLVHEIRELWASGQCSKTELAKRHGVYFQAIHHIVTEKSWKE